MKSKANKLDEIVSTLFQEGQACHDHDWDIPKENAKRKIISLCKECVPEEIIKEVEFENKYEQGWRLCRTETLKNIEEMGK